MCAPLDVICICVPAIHLPVKAAVTPTRHPDTARFIFIALLNIALYSVLLISPLFSTPVAAAKPSAPASQHALHQALQDARQQLNQGHNIKAIEALRRLRKQHKDSPEVDLLLGVALARDGKFGQASAVFKTLIEQHPKLVQAYNNLAAAQAGQGQLDQARKTLQRAIKQAPGYPVAHENLADIYSHLAESEYATATRLQPENQRLKDKLQNMRQFLATPSATRRATTRPARHPSASTNPLRVPSSPTATDSQARTPPPSASGCYRIGPFRRKHMLEDFAAVLDHASLAHRVQKHTDTETTWHVYLPPLASNTPSPAERRNKLRKQGIKDLALITRGDNKNAISLGVYSSPASVQRRLQQLSRLGWKARTEQRHNQKSRAWLHIKAKAATSMRDRIVKHSLQTLPATCP